MIKFVFLFTLFLGACASNQKFSQERLKDEGKGAWMVRALEVPCKDKVKECRDNVKKQITARSRKICKKQVFRVLKCDYEESSSTTIAASCKVHCGERPSAKDPVSSEHGEPKSEKEKSDDSKPFDWTDQ